MCPVLTCLIVSVLCRMNRRTDILLVCVLYMYMVLVRIQIKFISHIFQLLYGITIGLSDVTLLLVSNKFLLPDLTQSTFSCRNNKGC